MAVGGTPSVGHPYHHPRGSRHLALSLAPPLRQPFVLGNRVILNDAHLGGSSFSDKAEQGEGSKRRAWIAANQCCRLRDCALWPG